MLVAQGPAHRDERRHGRLLTTLAAGGRSGCGRCIGEVEPSSAAGQGGAEAGFLVQLVVVQRNQWMPENDRHERTDSGRQHRTMKNNGLIAHSTPETP